MTTFIEKIRNIETANFFLREKPTPLPSYIPFSKGFIGREKELELLRTSKNHGKTSFVLHGIGGVGKTQLALKFIEEVKSDYQAHLWVDMQGLSENALSPQEAILEIVREFKPETPSNLDKTSLYKLYISLLTQHKTLILLDNAKNREQVEPLNIPPALIVITSRMNFNVTGGFSTTVNQMSPEDAIILLYSIAGKDRFEKQADPLAKLAGNLPMALLPLASMLADDETLEATELVQRYADRKERLRLEDPNSENLSVEASFDLSYESLSDQLKENWRKLGVFPTDFNLEAVQDIWETEDARESCSALVRKHLVEHIKETNRFHLHDLVRDFTLERMNEDEFTIAKAIHSFHYGTILQGFDKVTPENLNKFDIERVNIKQGFDWLKSNIENFFDQVEGNLEREKEINTFCSLYTRYSNSILDLRIHPQQHLIWLELGLKVSVKTNDRFGEGCYKGNLATVFIRLGEYQKAKEYAEEALAISRELGDRKSETIDLNNLGQIYKSLGENQKAIEFAEEALAISRELGDRETEATQLGNWGKIYLNSGYSQKGIRHFENALIISREIGDRHSESIYLHNLAVAYGRLRENQKEKEYAEEALAISRELGDRETERGCLSHLAVVYLRLGEKAKGQKYFREFLVISRELATDKEGEGF